MKWFRDGRNAAHRHRLWWNVFFSIRKCQPDGARAEDGIIGAQRKTDLWSLVPSMEAVLGCQRTFTARTRLHLFFPEDVGSSSKATPSTLLPVKVSAFQQVFRIDLWQNLSASFALTRMCPPVNMQLPR